jgi:type VI secretion system secreted protein Hcp
MSTTDGRIDELSRRVDALSEQNMQLLHTIEAMRETGRPGLSRRDLLVGGAGAVGAVGVAAGTGLLAGPSPALAARSAAPGVIPIALMPPLPTRFYLTIIGADQQAFVGDVNGDGIPDVMIGFKGDVHVHQPYDMATGQPSGKRHWDPVTIVKEWDASSPRILQALATNERLPQVLMQMLGGGGSGIPPGAGPAAAYTITLTNALVVDFHQYAGDVASEEEGTTHVLEEISFTFQKIECKSISGKKSFSDSWLASP